VAFNEAADLSACFNAFMRYEANGGLITYNASESRFLRFINNIRNIIAKGATKIIISARVLDMVMERTSNIDMKANNSTSSRRLLKDLIEANLIVFL